LSPGTRSFASEMRGSGGPCGGSDLLSSCRTLTWLSYRSSNETGEETPLDWAHSKLRQCDLRRCVASDLIKIGLPWGTGYNRRATKERGLAGLCPSVPLKQRTEGGALGRDLRLERTTGTEIVSRRWLAREIARKFAVSCFQKPNFVLA